MTTENAAAAPGGSDDGQDATPASSASPADPPLDDEDATVVRSASSADPPSADEAATLLYGEPSADSPSGGTDATIIDTDDDDDATVIKATSPDSDATVTELIDEDMTTVNIVDDPDKTAVTGGDHSRDPRAILATGQTGADWATSIDEPPAGEIPGVDRELGEGDVLKQRFELVSKLGEGGMGAVWKALDKLKAEAQDRNPYVAVKLLQGDFKEHPEAFIALQRETAKQQRLAHPNIATVYDFDRDESSSTVYMTMEVMDGKPMDEFARQDIPKDGLSEEQAMPLIRDLCAGLAYAHDAKLVHSDLKPGNAFLVKDKDRELGRVKLLDFGIARASKTETDEEGEVTKFDPGKLGALTPTYATVEMFDGQDPDPRDDIYALAIMTYLLYTGKHPYGKKSGPKAMELGLVPELIAKLDKRQNRGLVRGLAFLREDRTPSVEQFLDDMAHKKSKAPMITGVVLAASVLLGVGLYSPVVDYLDTQEREEVITVLLQPGLENIRTGLDQARTLGEEQFARVLEDERTRDVVVGLITQGGERGIRDGLALIQGEGLQPLRAAIKDDTRTVEVIAGFIGRGDEESIRTGLELIEPFDTNWQRVVKDQPKAKTAIIDLYVDRMYQNILPEERKFDYAHAGRELAALEALYPDSADVFRIRNELKAHKEAELGKLNILYTQLLDAGKLIVDESEDDVGDIIALVEGIDPTHPMLKDPNLPVRYREQVNAAVSANDYQRADLILQAGAVHAPDDVELANLSHDVAAELRRQADEKLASEIQQRLQAQRQSFTNLDDFAGARTDLIKLA